MLVGYGTTAGDGSGESAGAEAGEGALRKKGLLAGVSSSTFFFREWNYRAERTGIDLPKPYGGIERALLCEMRVETEERLGFLRNVELFS